MGIPPASSGGEPIVALDPVTGAELGRVPEMGAGAVRALVERGRAAQPAWQALGFGERGRVLRRMQTWVIDHSEELIAAVPAETGQGFDEGMSGSGTLARALDFCTRDV